MTVCKEAITERSLTSDKAVLLIEWIITKVPWFDTKTRHFELLHELESFVFAANSVYPATLSTYITVLTRNLVPQDLTDGLDQVLAGQQVEVAGKRFANLEQLITFIEEDVLQGRAFGEEHIEIENEQYIELLISLFKFSKDDFAAGTVQKITFGPHASSNGSYGAFKIHRAAAVDPTAQDQPRITDEKGGRVFAVPSRRSVVEEVVSYVDSGRSLFAENLFNTEQGYIRSVNGVYFPRYLEAVERLLKRFPLRLGDFFESITNSFPHPRSEKIALVCSARNLLSLSVMMPAIERSVVGFMVGILSQLDCDTNISSTKDRAINGREKIDDIMQSMIQFINFRLDVTPATTLNQQRMEIAQLEGIRIFRERRGGGKKPSTKDKEQFVHTLLETFSTRVLKLEKPRTVHFLYYYICSIGGELEWVREAFLEGLVLNIGQPRLQRQPKLHSLLYLFSYLRASNSVSGLILHTSLTYMLDFLTENYSKYLKRNSQVSVRKRSSEDIRKERVFRQAGTEITSPIGDDIFVFCYQSCLDLFTLKRSLLSREELDDLTTKFDHAVDKTLDFITFSIAESETFFILFRSLQDSLEDCQTRRILEELFSSCPQPVGGKFVSPRNRREPPTPVRRSAVLRDIDYLPFKPIQMKFYEFYISPHLALPGGCESTPEPVHSPFDSGLSQVDTNNTENYFRPYSPLSKRKPRPWPDTGALSPMNKYTS